jgi:hypothetical protein
MSATARTTGGASLGDIRGAGRHQTSLRPETIGDDIGAQHPARFFEAFVEQLDLEP